MRSCVPQPSSHFPNLSAIVRVRLARRGIDPEKSLAAFLDEVRLKPPPRLLIDLGLAPIVREKDINGHAG